MKETTISHRHCSVFQKFHFQVFGPEMIIMEELCFSCLHNVEVSSFEMLFLHLVNLIGLLESFMEKVYIKFDKLV